MSKEATGITKITIAIAGAEVTCTPQQVKDLKAALEQMYPTPQNRLNDYLRDIDRSPYRPRPVPYWNEPYCLTAVAGDVSLEAK